MSIIGAPITAKVLIGFGVLAVLVMGEAGFILAQAKTIGRLEGDIRQRRDAYLQSQTDLGACQEGREAYQESLAACMNAVRTSTEDNAAARDTIQRLVDQIRQESTHVRRERKIILQNPSCEQLAAIDIAAACPDLAGSLRARAAQMSAAREGTNANPGAD